MKNDANGEIFSCVKCYKVDEIECWETMIVNVCNQIQYKYHLTYKQQNCSVRSVRHCIKTCDNSISKILHSIKQENQLYSNSPLKPFVV